MHKTLLIIIIIFLFTPLLSIHRNRTDFSINHLKKLIMDNKILKLYKIDKYNLDKTSVLKSQSNLFKNYKKVNNGFYIQIDESKKIKNIYVVENKKIEYVLKYYYYNNNQKSILYEIALFNYNYKDCSILINKNKKIKKYIMYSGYNVRDIIYHKKKENLIF